MGNSVPKPADTMSSLTGFLGSPCEQGNNLFLPHVAHVRQDVVVRLRRTVWVSNPHNILNVRSTVQSLQSVISAFTYFKVCFAD